MQALYSLGRGLLWCVASVEGRVFLLGKFCLLIAVYFSFFTAKGCIVAQSRSLRAFELSSSMDLADAKVKEPLSSYDIILRRNVFGQQGNETVEKKQETTQASNLDLRLVGTRIGSDGGSFAILENTKTKEQDVFELNEMIFEQGKLMEVMPETVKVEFQGRLETLALLEGESGLSEESPVQTDGDTIVVSEEELSKELANLPRLLSQARAVPFFRNGQSIGMRLFAIRRGSLYEKVGLKNGDILLSINDNSLSDPTQALKLFEELKNQEQLAVKVERNGKEKSLNYSIE